MFKFFKVNNHKNRIDISHSIFLGMNSHFLVDLLAAFFFPPFLAAAFFFPPAFFALFGAAALTGEATAAASTTTGAAAFFGALFLIAFDFPPFLATFALVDLFGAALAIIWVKSHA
jgi:hypothetical protein